MLFFIFFSILLLVANIYCFINKKYLYLFVPCFLFLPEYYAIDLSESLPLLTVSRIMTVIFFIYVLLNKRKTLKELFYAKIPRPYFLLISYVVFRVISNCYYITKYSFAAKTILEIIFEQVFLVLAFFLLSPSKDEIEKLIRVIVWTAFVLFIMGIVESLTSVRIFDCLYIVNRSILNEHYIRLGLLRATTTMGMPGIYSNVCLLILPLTLYLYNTTLKKRYLLVCFAELLAAIHSGSRAFFLYFVMIMAFYIIVVLHNKAERIRCMHNSLLILLSIFLFTTTLSLISPNYRYFYSGSVKAVLNEFGMDYDLNANAPEGIKGYGGNYDPNDKYQGGIASRKTQLSGIVYALNNNPVFGLGNGALLRDEIYYYYADHWSICRSIDVGLVEIVMNEGLLGLIAYAFLFIFLLISFNSRSASPLQNQVGLLMIMCYILTTFSTTNMTHFLIIILLLAVKSTNDSHILDN